MKAVILKDNEVGNYEAVDKIIDEFLKGLGYKGDLEIKEFKFNFPEEIVQFRVGESIDFLKFKGTQIYDILNDVYDAHYVILADSIRDSGIPARMASFMFVLGKYLKKCELEYKKVITFWLSEGIDSELHYKIVHEITDRCLWGIDRQTAVIHQTDLLCDYKFADAFNAKRYYLLIAGMDLECWGRIDDETLSNLARKSISDYVYNKYRDLKKRYDY